MTEINSIDKIGDYAEVEWTLNNYPYTTLGGTRRSDGVRVVLKTISDNFPYKEHIAALTREHMILSGLSHSGLIQPLDFIGYGEGNVAIVNPLFGKSLADCLSSIPEKKIDFDIFLDVASSLVHILGFVHQKGIIHKDINPNNILIDEKTKEIKLIDFCNASELQRENQQVASENQIRGSLPYISPELTGRMNRDIDYRSDYYSLGVTFFEMLTGHLPLHASDPLEWVHAHISRMPAHVIQYRPDVPGAINDVIQKMMAKNAEQRYQSAAGILADLEAVRAISKGKLTAASFVPGHKDVSMVFQIPQKLYGRDKELGLLHNSFRNACKGSFEFCVVSGYSGIGKSVLVQELGRSIAGMQGYLIQGKFEQFKQNEAYAALINALKNLVRLLLGEPKNRLDAWARQIQSALRNQAAIFTELIPDLEIIIGPQEPVQEIPPNEAQNRFTLLLIEFIKVFATQEHPLVLFLDDLQWSDIPTLNLLNRLVISDELHYLMIIGAYRNNAVDITHPLSLTLDEISAKREIVNIALNPLAEEAINSIVQDTLRIPSEKALHLTQILQDKTGGNPFFTVEMLKELHRDGAIFFDNDTGSWQWNIDKIQSAKYSDNVVEFLVSGFSRLPNETQIILQSSACLGATFDLQMIAAILHQQPEAIAKSLFPALQANLILPLNEDYRLASLMGSGDTYDEAQHLSGEVNPSYRFQHDRVQQAAYSMIAENEKSRLHFTIAQMILNNSSEKELEDQIVSVAEHLNQAKEMLVTKEELLNAARMNLRAGMKAKGSSAYSSALVYLHESLLLLQNFSWTTDPQIFKDLFSELQHCSYLTGDWKAADHYMEELLKHTTQDIERGLLHARRTRQLATTGRMIESIDAAYEGLAILGFQFNYEPTLKDIEDLSEEISNKLNGRSIASLIDLPLMTDEKAKIASDLLAEIFAAAFLSASGLKFPYVVMQSVKIALDFGNSPETAFAYTAYGMLLCGYYNNAPLGGQYGSLGVALIERFDDISLKSRIIYVYTMFTHHWGHHWSTMTPLFRRGIEYGYRSGDLLYLSYSAQDCIIWDPRLDLNTASQEQRKLLKIVAECEYQDSLDSGTLFLQMQLNFQGLTSDQYSLSDDSFDELVCFKGMQERKFMTGIANYHIYKTEIFLLYQEPQKALVHVLAQDQLMASVMSLPQLARYHHISFLVRSALFEELSEEDKNYHRSRMDESYAIMTQWASHCSDNFEHLRLMMEARMAELEDKYAEALVLYERSINQARKTGFIRDEAVANECMAHCLIHRGFEKAAEGYIRSAQHLYYRWGAHRKTEWMIGRYPFLQDQNYNQTYIKGKSDHANLKISSVNLSSNDLDISSVFRASQMISGELVLDKLLDSTLHLLTENAGAQHGCLIEQRDGNFYIHSDKHKSVMVYQDASEISELPMSIILTVLRTNTPLVIGDASESAVYSKESYIQSHNIKSLMCVPFAINQHFKLCIYLENNLTSNAFTESRYEVVKLLTAQAAISIENARIYEKQQTLLTAQQRFVPSQFLKHLGHHDISHVNLGESVGLEMTILFSDIRDFTPLVESLSPEAVIDLLNEYLSKVGVEIDSCGGFIDSYAGDEIMALFAVPPQKAVESAVRMTIALREFNEESKLIGRPILQMGIGLNTGNVVLGTMGGNSRMQCTVLGDAVNLASRIESLTKSYGAKLLIGENTYHAMDNREQYDIRFVDRVAVKGKAHAVSLYEVLNADHPDRHALKLATNDNLKLAHALYYQRDFLAALEVFQTCASLDPLDLVFPMFIHRCEQYLQQPPPESWQGFEVLKSKS